MPLNFPHQPDIRLANAPLAEVICQVRFPPILRIADEDPSGFQERIRNRFPLVELEHGLLVRLPGLGAKGEPAAEPQTRIFRFHSQDRLTAVSLAVDFFALSTKAYVDWDSFADNLRLATRAVTQVYRPTYATRIGLRYVNQFTRANTGCETIRELLEILRPELTAHAHNEIWGDAIQMDCRLLLADEPAKLTLGTRYAQEDGEPVFVLDLDYYVEGQLSLKRLVEQCAKFNQVIYRAFRWAIRDDRLPVFGLMSKEPRK